MEEIIIPSQILKELEEVIDEQFCFRGAEATLYPYDNNHRYLLKLFHESKEMPYAWRRMMGQKVCISKFLLRYPEFNQFMSIPKICIVDEIGKKRGFLIPFFPNCIPYGEYQGRSDIDRLTKIKTLQLLNDYLKQIHACPEHFFVNDMNYGNILVDSDFKPVFVDTDSFGKTFVLPDSYSPFLIAMEKRFGLNLDLYGQNTDRLILAMLALNLITPIDMINASKEEYIHYLKVLRNQGLSQEMIDFYYQIARKPTTKVGYLESYEQIFQMVK